MSADDVADRHRTREIDRADPIQTLLNSLTLENIRDAAYLLAPGKNVRIRSHKTSLDEILQTKKSREEIIQRLLEVEARTPFKHCLIAHCQEPIRIKRLEEQVKATVSTPSFDFVIRFYQQVGSDVYVTLEHTVVVRDWVEDEENEVKRLERYETRHPVIVRVQLATGLLLVSYPGFSQGAGTKRHAVIGYDQVTGAVAAVLKGAGIETKAFAIREALKVLMAGPNRRVHRIRADIEAANVGRFDLSSLDQKKTVEESLADLMLPHMGGTASRESLIEYAKKAINDTEPNFVLLYWVQESVITRLRFWDMGCEMFFTWHGERATYRTIDSIVGLLVETADRAGGLKTDSADGRPLAWIASLPGNEIVRSASLAERFGLTPSQVRQELVHAVKAGMVIPVYRLTSNEPLLDGLNAWTESPVDLKREWRTTTGAVIDGGDPRNVEVAFRRIVAVGGMNDV